MHLASRNISFFGSSSRAFTVEPRDGDGLEEAQGDDGAPDAKLLQQLDHIGAALRIRLHAGS